MAKVVKCKTCGADVAKSAKTCPSCGAKRKRPIIGGIIIILGILILISAFGGLGEKKIPNECITLEEFNRIKPGMTYEDVVAIIGGPGELLSEAEVMGVKTTIYIWYGDTTKTINANVTISDGKVFAKAQTGLK